MAFGEGLDKWLKWQYKTNREEKMRLGKEISHGLVNLKVKKRKRRKVCQSNLEKGKDKCWKK